MTHKFRSLGSAAITDKNIHLIQFPGFVSPKIDGIRIFEYNGIPVTRSLKPMRNHHVATQLTYFYKKTRSLLGLVGIDGEITVGPAFHPNVIQATSSGIMSYQGSPENWGYHIFDSYQHSERPYKERLERIKMIWGTSGIPYLDKIHLVDQILVRNLEELLEVEKRYLGMGYEGIMYRSLNGKYKNNHSTFKEGILLKLKRFVDDEAEIVGFEELQHNMNPATISATGYTERMGGVSGMVPGDTLGAFIAKSKKFTKEFNVGMGAGLTFEMRNYYWNHRDQYKGKLLKYKYFDIGVKDRPRIPKYIGIRSEDDMES